MHHDVPLSLRHWFVFHFFADYIFAIPLFIAPYWFLGLFGFTMIDPVSARLVAAALVGIGGASLLTRNSGAESYRALLDTKILWSVTANLGFIVSLAQGAPWGTWVFLGIFLAFSTLWISYRIRMS